MKHPPHCAHATACDTVYSCAGVSFPDSFAGETLKALWDLYDALASDYFRYSASGPEFHRATFMEAGRRRNLIREEITRRVR